jgi:hypothetical protein
MSEHTPTPEDHPMRESALHAVAQGWCEPETVKYQMDTVLAGAIARPVERVLKAWYETAMQHCRNEEYYRGLVQQIGELFGAVAYVSDDGSVQQDVLCAKVPELVQRTLRSHAALVGALENLLTFDRVERPAFRLKPEGAPGSDARIRQEKLIALEDAARAALAAAKGE